MKYLRLFENFEDIHSICKKYGIENYTINDDGTVDVDGDVDLLNKELTKIPLKFRNVSGDFICYYNQLMSLEGAPESVGGHFWCNNNQLTTLEGAPKSVGSSFFCSYNQLKTLEGAPERVGGGSFYCNDNQLTTLEGAPKSVGNNFYCVNNPINSLVVSWINLNKNRRAEMIEYFNDLDIIHGDKVILMYLEEFMDNFGVKIDLDEVKKHYKIV